MMIPISAAVERAPARYGCSFPLIRALTSLGAGRDAASHDAVRYGTMKDNVIARSLARMRRLQRATREIVCPTISRAFRGSEGTFGHHGLRCAAGDSERSLPRLRFSSVAAACNATTQRFSRIPARGSNCWTSYRCGLQRVLKLTLRDSDAVSRVPLSSLRRGQQRARRMNRLRGAHRNGTRAEERSKLWQARLTRTGCVRCAGSAAVRRMCSFHSRLGNA